MLNFGTLFSRVNKLRDDDTCLTAIFQDNLDKLVSEYPHSGFCRS